MEKFIDLDDEIIDLVNNNFDKLLLKLKETMEISDILLQTKVKFVSDGNDNLGIQGKYTFHDYAIEYDSILSISQSPDDGECYIEVRGSSNIVVKDDYYSLMAKWSKYLLNIAYKKK